MGDETLVDLLLNIHREPETKVWTTRQKILKSMTHNVQVAND